MDALPKENIEARAIANAVQSANFPPSVQLTNSSRPTPNVQLSPMDHEQIVLNQSASQMPGLALVSQLPTIYGIYDYLNVKQSYYFPTAELPSQSRHDYISIFSIGQQTEMSTAVSYHIQFNSV